MTTTERSPVAAGPVVRPVPGPFDATWRRIVHTRTPAVEALLEAQGAVLLRGGHRTVVEIGCADGTLLRPVVARLGLRYVGLDVAAEAVDAARASGAPDDIVLHADGATLPRLMAQGRVQLDPPALVALPFNVLGNMPDPAGALAAVADTGADVLVLGYAVGDRARAVRAEYHAACGFEGRFTRDATGDHFTGHHFRSSVYEADLVAGWLAGPGAVVDRIPFGDVGLALHRRG